MNSSLPKSACNGLTGIDKELWTGQSGDSASCMTFLCRDSTQEHRSTLGPSRWLAHSLLRLHSCLLLPLTSALRWAGPPWFPIKVPKQIPFLHLVMCRPERRERRQLSLQSGSSLPLSEKGFLSHDGDGNANIASLPGLNWDGKWGQVKGGGASFFFSVETSEVKVGSTSRHPTNFSFAAVFFCAAVFWDGMSRERKTIF